MRASPVIAWVLVAVGAVVGVLTVLLAGTFAGGYGPTTGDWRDGALFALQTGGIGVLIAIAACVLAIIFGKGAWVRVAASVVIAGVFLAVPAVGAAGAVQRYADAPKEPDCLSGGMETAAEIQGGFDELEHSGWIDTIATGVDGCAATVRNLTAVEVADHYRDQLVDAGWDVEVDESDHLVATRGDYSFIVENCGGVWIVIEETDAEWTYC